MSMHALIEKALVLNLSIGIWQGYRLDKEASRKVTEGAGAHADAARVNKHLVPKEALAPIVAAQTQVRSHFYENTLPWRDNGDRLMTRKLFTAFIETHERLVSEFKEAVEDFLVKSYPVVREQAEFRLGDLFNPDDYPTAADIRRRFYITLDFEALTTTNDFRVQIDEAHVEKVRAAMEAAAERRVHTAMQDVWKRLAETVGYFQERLSDPDKIFRDTTVENVAELIDMIPGLNVLDDPGIEAIRQQVKAKLIGHDAADIRKDPALRQELAGEAKAIIDKMAGFMAVWGPAK